MKVCKHTTLEQIAAPYESRECAACAAELAAEAAEAAAAEAYALDESVRVALCLSEEQWSALPEATRTILHMWYLE